MDEHPHVKTGTTEHHAAHTLVGKEPQWSVDPDLKMNCKDCSADCCKHIAIPINEPKTWEEIERIKWYLCHENVTVYKDIENDWLVEFISKCGQLNGHRCLAWGTDRYPHICGEYDMRTCVMNEEGEYWEILFKTPQDAQDYAEKEGIVKPETPTSQKEQVCICIPIDAPEEWSDYDDMRWYIAHRDVRVLRKGEDWYVHCNTLCKLVEGKPACEIRDNHIPHDADLIFKTWDELDMHCKRIGIHPSQTNTNTSAPVQGKDALKLTDA